MLISLDLEKFVLGDVLTTTKIPQGKGLTLSDMPEYVFPQSENKDDLDASTFPLQR